jgi:hypothetical protein
VFTVQYCLLTVNRAAWPCKSEELMLILVVTYVNKVGGFGCRGKKWFQLVLILLVH